MFCPNDACPDFVDTGLRSEYRQDVASCPYCGTPTVPHRPDEPVADDDPGRGKPRVADDEVMEQVFEAGSLTEVAIVKSVLDAGRIPFVTVGEGQFSAFRGAFAGGSIFNPRSRGVVFEVPSRMADEARTLLEAIEDDPAPPEP